MQKRVQCLLGSGKIRSGDQANGDLGVAWSSDEVARQHIRISRCRLQHYRHHKVSGLRTPSPITMAIWTGQQAPPQHRRLIVLADAEPASRLQVGCTPGVDVGIGHDHVVRGKRDFGGAFGKEVTETVALLVEVMPGDAVEGLRAGRPDLEASMYAS